MLLILFDLLIVSTIIMVLVYLANKVIVANKEQKLADALARQEQAKQAAELATKVNPDQIKADEAKVQDTLNKLQ